MDRNFYLRFEEMYSVVPFIRNNLFRDLVNFTDFSPKYDQAYIDNLDVKIVKLDNIANNKIKIGEVKLFTSEIYKAMFGMRESINFLDAYAEEASGLTVSYKDWPFSLIRKMIRNKNVDGAELGLVTLRQLITDNFIKLENEGYNDVKFNDYKVKVAHIISLNQARNLKIEEKMAVVQENIVFLNDIFDQTRKIARLGKKLFKISKPEKVADYTISKIVKRITHKVSPEEKVKPNAWIEGKVLDFETLAPLASVSVWTNSMKTVVITDENGYFKLGLVAEITEMVYATLAHYVNFSEDVEIDEGVTMQLDIEMEKVEE